MFNFRHRTKAFPVEEATAGHCYRVDRRTGGLQWGHGEVQLWAPPQHAHNSLKPSKPFATYDHKLNPRASPDPPACHAATIRTTHISPTPPPTPRTVTKRHPSEPGPYATQFQELPAPDSANVRRAMQCETYNVAPAATPHPQRLRFHSHSHALLPPSHTAVPHPWSHALASTPSLSHTPPPFLITPAQPMWTPARNTTTNTFRPVFSTIPAPCNTCDISCECPRHFRAYPAARMWTPRAMQTRARPAPCEANPRFNPCATPARCRCPTLFRARPHAADVYTAEGCKYELARPRVMQPPAHNSCAMSGAMRMAPAIFVPAAVPPMWTLPHTTGAFAQCPPLGPLATSLCHSPEWCERKRAVK
ncbi:hypothetical protein B0H12DRAFT_1236972 [Mycena haematopus]|nr:hypothetical protein B0H12DRAFT_1236972 [Mycena haematopus]